MDVEEAEDYRRVLVRVAGEAAGLLRDLACEEEYTVRVSGETMRADLEAENYIVDALKHEGYGGVVVSEESGLVRLGGEGPIFIVDPLDGSTNYGACIPWSSVSIAVAPPGSKSVRDVVAGVVAPVFYGGPVSFARGRGCFEGSRPVEPRPEPLGVVYVYVEHPEAAMALARVTRGLGGVKVRSLGSAALEMVYTALGRGMLFLDLRSRLRNVDVAAAMGVTLECRGEVVDSRGAPLDSSLEGVVKVGTVISSPQPRLLERVLQLLRGGEP